MPDSSIGDVVSFPDQETKDCRFRLIKDGKILGEVTFPDEVGPDGKAIFEKVVEASITSRSRGVKN